MKIKIIDGRIPGGTFEIEIDKLDLISIIKNKIDQYSKNRENDFLICKNIILRNENLINFYKICEDDQIWCGRIENYFNCDNIIVSVFMVSWYLGNFIHLIVTDCTSIGGIISILEGILPAESKIINLWNYVGDTMTNDQLVRDLATEKDERLIICKLDDGDINKSFGDCCDIYDQNLVNELWTIRPILPRFDLTNTIKEKMSFLRESILLVTRMKEKIHDDFWNKMRCLKHSRFLCSSTFASNACYILFQDFRHMIRGPYEERYKKWDLFDAFLLDQLENHLYVSGCIAGHNYLDIASGSFGSSLLFDCKLKSQAVKYFIDCITEDLDRIFDNPLDNREYSWRFLDLVLMKHRDHIWKSSVSSIIENTIKPYSILKINGYPDIFVNTPKNIITIRDYKRAISAQTNEPLSGLFLSFNRCDRKPKDDDQFNRTYQEGYSCNIIRSMDDIEILHEIDRGTFAKVLLCKHKKTANLLALKIPFEIDISSSEIILHSIMASHSSLYQIKLFKYEDSICIATPYMPGGTLGEFIKKNKFLQEPEIAKIIHQILLQIRDIHNCGIVHRDIKPENILMHDDHNWRLIDFGISKLNLQTTLGEANKIKYNDDFGTFNFMAPEYFCDYSYSSSCDIWSLGALVTEMLTGKRLYSELNSMKAIEEIASKKKIEFDAPYTISEELTDFINSCLEPEQEKRANIDDLIESKFIKKYCDKIQR